MPQQWDISNSKYRENFNRFVDKMISDGKKPVVEFIDPRRSRSQNDIINGLYRQISNQKDDESFIDTRRRCKLLWAVPLLRASNKKFATLYDKTMKHNLTYEEKLEAMDILPVTSLMGKAVASDYVGTVIREHSAQGLCLVHPSQVTQ